MTMPLAFQMPGMGEWIVIAVIGLLFFGKRLPEVGRSLGQGIVQFKKGLKDVEEEVAGAVHTPTPSAPAAPAQPAYKFDPYTGKPVESSTTPTV